MSRLGATDANKKGFNGRTFAKTAGAVGELQVTETLVVLGKDASNVTNTRNNIFIGNAAGNSDAGGFNTVVGSEAGVALNASSQDNVYVGGLSGNLSVGLGNTCVGVNSGQFMRAGSNNTLVGKNAGMKLSGSGNVAVGADACSSAISAGSHNILIGSDGCNVTGSNNIVIGSNLYSSVTDVSNVINIGGVFGADTALQSITLGLGRGHTGDDSSGSLLGITGDGALYRHTAKTFVIDHPVSRGRYLVHSCIEGDKSRVHYSGTATVSRPAADGYVCGVELPHYFCHLADEATANVQLTPNKRAVTWCGGIRDNGFSIFADARCTVHWSVVAERTDVPPLVTEPLKASCEVGGAGPYTYIVPSDI